jgi:hypothetical protein
MYLCARGIDSVQSLDSEWRHTCVRGVLILYKAWIVSGDILLCEGYNTPRTQVRRHSLSRLCIESIPLAHKYIATHYPGFVQNQYPSHTSTSPLTIQALYRINTPRTQVHRHSLSRLCTESIRICVRGVLILYKAWIVSDDVLVCEGY